MSKTGYFTHRDCWKHEMGPGHPEGPERLDAIEDQLTDSAMQFQGSLPEPDFGEVEMDMGDVSMDDHLY